MSQNGNDLFTESPYSVRSGMTQNFVPFIDLMDGDTVVAKFDAAETFQLGMQMILLSRSVIDEVNLFKIFSELDIPLETAMGVVNRLRKDRGN